MSEFIVLEAGHDGVFAAGDASARCQMAGNAIRGREVIGLVIGDRGEIGGDVLNDVLEIGLLEGLDR